MTPTAVLSVNTAVNANPAASSHAPPVQDGSGSHARADFRKPLQQARQQQARQQQARQQQQTSQASPRASASRDAAPAAKSTTAPRHGTTDDARGQDEKPSSAPATPTPDAATAMLALLGQSIPAQAAPAPVPAPVPTGQGDAAASAGGVTLPAGMQAIANLQVPAMTPPGAQADADDMLDSKSVDALKDSALSTGDASGEVDEKTPAFTDALAAMAKAPAEGQSSQPMSNDHGRTLDALGQLLAAPQAPAQTAAATTPAAHALSMQASAGTPAFAQELGQQVAWLGGQDVKEARIRLHPEDLGQLDVKVSVKQDHVDVSFIAQHPQAVHAVQQTLGQLDTLLAHHGLSLGHAEVGQGGRGNESGQGSTSSGANRGGDDSSTESGSIAAVAAPVIKAIGLLDTFA